MGGKTSFCQGKTNDADGTVFGGQTNSDNVLQLTTTYKGMNPLVQAFTYYPDGSLKTLKIPGETDAWTYTYLYSKNGELTEIQLPKVPSGLSATGTPVNPVSAMQKVKFAYNADGTFYKQFTPLANLDYAYDSRGRLTKVNNSYLFTDASGAGLSGTYSTYNSFTYDVADRMTGVTISNTQQVFSGNPAPLSNGATFNIDGNITYTYDANGNLAKEKRLSTKTGRNIYPLGKALDSNSLVWDSDTGYMVKWGWLAVQHDLDNNIAVNSTSTNTVMPFGKDKNGSVTQVGPQQFTLNPDGTLREVNGVVQYGYRPDGKQAYRQKPNDPTSRVYFLYGPDGETMGEYKLKSGTTNQLQAANHYLWGPKGLAMRWNFMAGTQDIECYTFDHLGHVITRLKNDPNNNERKYPDSVAVYDAIGACWADKDTHVGNGTTADGSMDYPLRYTIGAWAQKKLSDPLLLAPPRGTAFRIGNGAIYDGITNLQLSPAILDTYSAEDLFRKDMKDYTEYIQQTADMYAWKRVPYLGIPINPLGFLTDMGASAWKGVLDLETAALQPQDFSPLGFSLNALGAVPGVSGLLEGAAAKSAARSLAKEKAAEAAGNAVKHEAVEATERVAAMQFRKFGGKQLKVFNSKPATFSKEISALKPGEAPDAHKLARFLLDWPEKKGATLAVGVKQVGDDIIVAVAYNGGKMPDYTLRRLWTLAEKNGWKIDLAGDRIAGVHAESYLKTILDGGDVGATTRMCLDCIKNLGTNYRPRTPTGGTYPNWKPLPTGWPMTGRVVK